MTDRCEEDIADALLAATHNHYEEWRLLATDAAAQRAFAAERGLCPVHTWQYQEMASPQGISDGYAPLIEALAGELSHLIECPPEQASEALAALLATTATCPACRLLRETTIERIQQLLIHLTSQEGRADYLSSAGLCLPHLQLALAHLQRPAEETSEHSALAEFLLREQVRRLAELAKDLRSYALKRDALRRGLLHQEEASAWHRALVQVVGERAARGDALMADTGTV